MASTTGGSMAAGKQVESEISWRLFEIHKSSMDAVGKAQGRFVNAILAYLAILWGWWLMKPSDMSIDFHW